MFRAISSNISSSRIDSVPGTRHIRCGGHSLNFLLVGKTPGGSRIRSSADRLEVTMQDEQPNANGRGPNESVTNAEPGDSR